MSKLPEWVSNLDFSAMESSPNKISECEFFLSLAAKELDREKFRWFISAFLNAAYSYFEMTALKAYFSYIDTETGSPLKDMESLDILRAYVKIEKRSEQSDFVKTKGLHPITQQLYEFRRRNTHHFPLSIMVAGKNIPEDFQFGHIQEEGIPVMKFCREALALMHEVQRKLGL